MPHHKLGILYSEKEEKQSKLLDQRRSRESETAEDSTLAGWVYLENRTCRGGSLSRELQLTAVYSFRVDNREVCGKYQEVGRIKLIVFHSCKVLKAAGEFDTEQWCKVSVFQGR
jgi:hypothetical protein